MRKLLLFLCIISSLALSAQNQDSLRIRAIYDEALTSLKSYDYLTELCKGIGHRLTASPNSYKAVDWGYDLLKSLGADTVYKQEIMVPHWVRNEKSSVKIKGEQKPLHATALGMSIGTDGKTIEGELLIVHQLKELDTLGAEVVKDKIVLYNRALNPRFINTGNAYGSCFDQRWWGASNAAKYGAKAVLVRSLSLKEDSFPHSGGMRYVDTIKRIPSAAISIKDANRLGQLYLNGEKPTITMKMNCELRPDTIHYNVVAEIKGSEFPDEIITIGGHLDSWDLGEGAHDDGAGIAHTIEAMRLLLQTGYRPQRTLRFVLFMNEENGNMGGKTYAKYAKEKGENHYCAIESDRGGFTPRGFTIDGPNEHVKHIQQWADLLAPYDINVLKKGWGGVDIKPLKENGPITLIGYLPDNQRYFDHHHAASDVLENVHPRELELGAASIASLIYLIDTYGLPARILEQEKKEIH